MPNCAFLTIADTEGWFIDDDLVHEPLRDLGWTIENVPWDAPATWDDFDLVVIRSPWDYQKHLDRFLKVLDNIEDSRAILLNSRKLVQWNLNKNYLFELERKGVEVVPTLKHASVKSSDIVNAFNRFQTEALIVKPIIGANADDTFRIHKKDVAGLSGVTAFTEVAALFHERECLIQPFMQNIVDEGEFSLMYFQGALSHVVLKTAATGDYRIQEEHGGGVTPVEKPEALLVASANRAMKTLSETPLYARVDLVRTPQNTFALMEFELIEPCLYFRFDARSARNFARCIDRYWVKR
jgi:glutathione synthase/RimK-type ligase-like ATP-grasp enzyme